MSDRAIRRKRELVALRADRARLEILMRVVAVTRNQIDRWLAHKDTHTRVHTQGKT